MNTPTPGTLARSWGFILYDTRDPLHFYLPCYSPVTMSNLNLKPYTLYETADPNKLAFMNESKRVFSCERKLFHPAMFFSTMRELFGGKCTEPLDENVHSKTIDPIISLPIPFDQALSLFDIGFTQSMFCTVGNVPRPSLDFLGNNLDVMRINPDGSISKYDKGNEAWLEPRLFSYYHSLQFFTTILFPNPL